MIHLLRSGEVLPSTQTFIFLGFKEEAARVAALEEHFGDCLDELVLDIACGCLRGPGRLGRGFQVGQDGTLRLCIPNNAKKFPGMSS